MEPANLDFLHWRALTRSINKIKAEVPRFLQEKVFRKKPPSASKTIDLYVKKGNEKLLPFVTDVEGGVLVEGTKREVQSVSAPRIRPKKTLDANKLLLESADNGFFYASGAQDVLQAAEAYVADEQLDLKNRMELTKEWMCAQALTGAITVTQDNIAFQIDFRLPDEHKPVLAAGVKWGTDGADIPGNLRTWNKLIRSATKKGADLLLLGDTAADKFETDADVLAELNNRRVAAGELDLKMDSDFIGYYKGLEVWRYPFEYKNEAGSKVKILGAGAAVLINTRADFTMEHGLITDLKARAQVVGEYFAKSFEQEDPSGLILISESRPLPVIWEPEAIVFATVL